MGLGNILRKTGLCITLAVVTAAIILALGTRIVHADNKEIIENNLDSETKVEQVEENPKATSLFPSPNVPYRIPLDRSPEEQAEYLYEVLKENSYSKLETQLKRYVPELEKIDKEDIEPLYDIVALAVKATNPEVKEAFDLMIRGGRRGGGPNTELQILFWLAEQNEFRKNDTLALAIAMVNGLWVTMGTHDVEVKVKEDTNHMLDFGRETAEWQETLGLSYNLDNYPLEAKVSWAWTGNYAAMGGRNQHLPSFKNKRLPLWAYEWLTVSELDKMRGDIIGREWVSGDVDSFMSLVEKFFYFSIAQNWIYKDGNEMILIDGKNTVNHDTSNADFLFNFFLDNGYVIGDCGDETTLVDALAISSGIATNAISIMISSEEQTYRHFYNLYFDPRTSRWKAYKGHLGRTMYPLRFWNRRDIPIHIYVHKPPVDQRRYLEDTDYTKPLYTGKTVYRNDGYTVHTLQDALTSGIPTDTVKRWLLY